MMDEFTGRVIDYAARQLVSGIARATCRLCEDMKKNNPRWIREQIYRIARENRGEITLARAVSELSIKETKVIEVLLHLVHEKACSIEYMDGYLYVFPALKARTDLMVCEYCNSTFNSGAQGSLCSNCGAVLNKASTF
ncbi:MAG: hypothetical protein RDV48_10940 [Candidatus Eremiobacteraeota bacterium]|nr:hypothetical protein [Candidatus Eremiobacteraeota bacterium]